MSDNDVVVIAPLPPDNVLVVDQTTGIVQINAGLRGPQGDRGPAGTSAEALSEIFTQGVASSTWTINHTLEFQPNVTVVDSGGRVVEGDVTYVDATHIVVTFSSAFSGTAYLS